MEGRGVEEGAGGGGGPDGEARDWFDAPGVFESLKRVVASGQDGGDARDVDGEKLEASAAETPAREGIWERGRLNFGTFSAAMRGSMFQALDQLPGIAALSKSPMVSALAPYTPLAVKSWIAEHEALALLGLAVWFALVAVLLTHLVTRAIAKARRKKPLPTIMGMLESDPDLHIFLGYWQAIGDVGPWDRPDLDKPPAPTARPQEGVAEENMILFAPTNDAFQSQEGQRVIMNTDAAQWRKLLVSHCAFTTMQPADLAYADTLKTCTGAIIKLDSLRDSYSDGSTKHTNGAQASNGIVFKVRKIMEPSEL